MFCLPKYVTEKFLKKLPEDISKLIDMTSEQRRSFFAEIAGEKSAKEINALFESKLILKNQQAGLINWAQKVGGLKPEVKRDFITRVQKMDKILNPDELGVFLEDIVEKRLGFGVTQEEAGRIAWLAREVEGLKAKAENSPFGSTERYNYGLALETFKTYVGELKYEAARLKLKDFKTNPLSSIPRIIPEISGQAKALLSTLDNSFFGRQGFKVLFNHPTVWTKNFLKSWKDIGQTLKTGEEATKYIKADVYSRPNAMNGKYDAMDLAIGIRGEEAFPSSHFAKIPAFGRLFKASESAYNGAALRMRADIADILIKNAEDAGLNMLDKSEAKPIGKIVNSLTGRGALGKLEPISDTLNKALFSARFLKSQIDTLTAHQFQKGITPYARKIAAANFARTIGGMAGILLLADRLYPGSVTWDPRSSDFGKIKIGRTRFDMTGGAAGLATLVGRVATHKYKSSTTGKVTDLWSGKYGQPDVMDVMYSFLEGKASPGLGTAIDYFRHETFSGDVPTLGTTITGLTVPLPIMTYKELTENSDKAGVWVPFILSQLGIGVNAY